MSAPSSKKRSAKKNKAAPRERLLETAAELFYRQGYSVTGINQIIAESGTHKASFYRHFETKEDLALAYLELRGEYFRALLLRLTGRAENSGGASLESFATSWVNFTLREVRQGRFYGCPIANFRGQVPEPDERQAALLRAIIDGWLKVLADFIRNERERQSDAKGDAVVETDSPEKIAIQFLKIYEGSAQLYRLTEDDAYLRSMKAEMLAAARRPTSTQRT